MENADENTFSGLDRSLNNVQQNFQYHKKSTFVSFNMKQITINKKKVHTSVQDSLNIKTAFLNLVISGGFFFC
jgi:hypothetical protein